MQHIRQVNKIIYTAAQDVVNEFNMNKTVKFDKHRSGGGIIKKKQNSLWIGLKDIYDNMQNNYVRDQDFVFVILIVYHEKGHLIQQQKFQQTNVSPDVQQMARIDLISTTIPEYYRPQSGYYYNINEIDAELHGIVETRKFFKLNFPEIDADTELMHIIQESSNWYASKKFHTIDEAIQNLETAKEESCHKHISLPLKYCVPSKPSPALKAFMKSKERIDAYLDFSDGQQANQYLLDFIAEKQPWRFYRYPCIRDEWPESAKDKTAKPPILAEQRHLDRGTEAELTLGIITGDQPDGTEYQMS